MVADMVDKITVVEDIQQEKREILFLFSSHG
jgi:hypothetical protein